MVPGNASKVMLGLSGGVDSAVAALLLLREGYDVTAVFMKNWDEDDGTEYCTAEQDFDDAQRIADKLGIPLQTINFSAEYWDRVFEEFLAEYRRGRTPNPDVLCNREIKFGLFLDYAEQLGMELIATGHYARREQSGETFGLYQAQDRNKDQTYFLQAVPATKLSRCLFPLANISKEEVRAIARESGLHVFDKKDSTGICFIGERRFSDFLARFVSDSGGEITDTKGRLVGEHRGLPYYTLGQREGLGIGGKRNSREAPWYVVEKHMETNRLVVTQNESDLMHHELLASDPNWLVDNPDRYADCLGAVRYRQAPTSCQFLIESDTVNVRFAQPQRAITPGQFVALYADNQCLGGACIEQVSA